MIPVALWWFCPFFNWSFLLTLPCWPSLHPLSALMRAKHRNNSTHNCYIRPVNRMHLFALHTTSDRYYVFLGPGRELCFLLVGFSHQVMPVLDSNHYARVSFWFFLLLVRYPVGCFVQFNDRDLHVGPSLSWAMAGGIWLGPLHFRAPLSTWQLAKKQTRNSISLFVITTNGQTSSSSQRGVRWEVAQQLEKMEHEEHIIDGDNSSDNDY